MKIRHILALFAVGFLQACGGSGSDSPNSYTIEGRAIDGPLSGSQVFLDLNGNSELDDGEPSTTSDAEGYFTISKSGDTDLSAAQIVVVGGTDTFTDIVMNDLMLLSDLPADLNSFISVTPISSIIANAETKLDKQAILDKLQIAKDVDEFLAMDHWKIANQGDELGQRIQQINQQVAVMINSAQSMVDDSEDLLKVSKSVAKALAEKAKEEDLLDLSSNIMLEDIFNKALIDKESISAAAVAAVTNNLADVNSLLQTDSVITPSAKEFIKEIQTDLKDLVADVTKGDLSINDFTSQANVDKVFANIDFFVKQIDTDSDGIIDALDPDDDNDGTLDKFDDSPKGEGSEGKYYGLKLQSTSNNNGTSSITWDFDGNGQIDALTDGLLLLRHAFGISGNLLVNGVIAADSPYTESEVESNVGAAYAIADIDGSGHVDALTDALLLLRYLFGITGDDLTTNTIALNATRSTSAEIEQYIQSHMSADEGTADETDNGTDGADENSTDMLVFHQGAVASTWDAGINAFDEAIGWAECNRDGGAGCPSIDWQIVTDAERGDVLQVSHGSSGSMAGLFFKSSTGVDLSSYSDGEIQFDIKVVSGDSQITMKLDCVWPCTSGDRSLGSKGANGWETVSVSMSSLASGGLNLSNVDTGLVIWATNKTNTVFHLDNVRFTGSDDPNSGNAGDTGNTGNTDNTDNTDNTGDAGNTGGDIDADATVKPPADFIEAFGGTQISDNVFTFPSSAESWGGFANMNQNLYPLTFSEGGSVSFVGSVPSGGTANIKFRFEKNSYPDHEPLFETQMVTISGSEPQTYNVNVPSQGGLVFNNFIFYIAERNRAVDISNVLVTTTGSAANTGGTGIQPPENYNVINYGAGSIGDTIYTSNHRCKEDWGQWVENAGVISTEHEVQKLGCNQTTGIPTGNITKLYPQLAGPAANKPTQTHKWWGSLSFMGEMTVGDPNDAAYITPDPISARITNKGARVGSIPAGMRLISGGQYYYPIPAHEYEVFDGIAVGNSSYSNLEAYTKDYSEGSVTVIWKSGNTDVMEATFVHGSPYVYFKAYVGSLELRTLRQDGVNEKGTFSTGSNKYGIWTSVAGNANNYLIVGEGTTTFTDVSSSSDPMTMGSIRVNNAAKEMTLVYLPSSSPGNPSSTMVNYFASMARNKVAALNIDYQVNRATNEITVTHSYVDAQGAPVNTIAGMHPLHWKNTSASTSNYKVRSARGIIKFASLNQYNYKIPYVGVLPTMPTIDGSFDQATLENLVTQFINQGSGSWNTFQDTYWSGKNYGKVAELAAIARSIGMQNEADQLTTWLKAELADWFTAEADGQLKTKKYFVYDSDWNTLFGFDEAYGAHQRIADHHFHYGYFVRAAAEICRVDLAWCSQEQYGPMIELLIRDYAADKDDPLFPHMRNFDPANGFSWADGKMNFIRGNNNESTSEAATAYGAIILYGLATGNEALTEKGMYLHASTGAAYWEYWNNLDGYNNVSADADNFYPGYAHLTTSIIWGDGVDFATWFSGAYAHILGIQGLPSSPLIFHVGTYPDYMEDYVSLGLSESSNGKPSGLGNDMWRDLWWNLWSMTDADAAVADYNSASSYVPEQGESKAHTYHWIHTFKALGHLATGTGSLTADHPAAIVFDKDGDKTYVVYNFSNQAKTVSFSDGHTVNAAPTGFTID